MYVKVYVMAVYNMINVFIIVPVIKLCTVYNTELKDICLQSCAVKGVRPAYGKPNYSNKITVLLG